MSPYYEARKLYKRGELDALIKFCASNGIVHADAEYFICAYPTHHLLLQQNLNNNLDKADTWVVCIAAGNAIKAFDLGQPLQYIAWQRFDKRFRIMEFDRFRRLYGKFIRAR